MKTALFVILLLFAFQLWWKYCLLNTVFSLSRSYSHFKFWLYLCVNKNFFMATSGNSATESSFEQLPMHSCTWRMSEHRLQNCSSVYFLVFSEQGQDDEDGSVLYLNHRKPVMVLGMQNILCTDMGKRVAHAMWHISEESSRGTAFSCDLLSASESFYPGVVLVLCSCAQMPNELNLLRFKTFVLLFWL